MGQNLRYQLVLRSFSPTQLCAREIEVFEKVIKILFALRPHRALLDVIQNPLEVLEDEHITVRSVSIAPARHRREKLRRFEKVSQRLDSLFADRFQILLSFA